MPKSVAFLVIFPVTLLLSFIRTLNRLAVASLLANLLQAIGLALIVEYLIRDLDKVNFDDRDKFRPISEMALGFGSAMFAFEGISVVLPLYSRMKTPEKMLGACGVINISFVCILVLYFIMGLLGFLKYGHSVKDSITLNLPAEPLYDAVRGMFTISILLSYPLQFYVPNEIIWKWAKKNLFGPTEQELSVMRAIEVVIPPGTKITESIDGVKNYHMNTAPPVALSSDSDLSSTGRAVDDSTINNVNHKSKISTKITTKASPGQTTTSVPSTTTIVTSKTATNAPQSSDNNNKQQSTLSQDSTPTMYEYVCRLLLVILTFTLAFSVPKLNLLMDLIGSFSGAALCLTIPAAIHLAAYWNEKRGASKAFMVIFDSVIIVFSLAAGLGGSLSSLNSIVKSFH